MRGINVGGNNIIKMAELKDCFEKMGFSGVSTYIQSGNVLFESQKSNLELEKLIEKNLSEWFKYKSKVVVISKNQFLETVKEAPSGFGKSPDKFRYDVIFLKKPLTAKEAIKQVKVKKGVDTAHAGKHALYFSRLISKASQSSLPKLVGLLVYKDMTIRNWNTTTKILQLMEK